MHIFRQLVVAASAGLALTGIEGGVRSEPTSAAVPIECKVSKNNDGCTTTVRCPEGMTVKSASAACNLEWGSVRKRQVTRLQANVIKVLRPSDHVEEGSCWVGSATLSEGKAKISGIERRTEVAVGCREYDANGGDCEIRGVLRCE